MRAGFSTFLAGSDSVAWRNSRTKYPPFAVGRSSSRSLSSLPLVRMVFIISMMPDWISAKVWAGLGVGMVMMMLFSCSATMCFSFKPIFPIFGTNIHPVGQNTTRMFRKSEYIFFQAIFLI